MDAESQQIELKEGDELQNCNDEPKDENDDDNENNEEETPFIDLSNHCIKSDMFDGIHILDNSFPKIYGAPNFRQILGFPVFGCGQPTEEAMVEIINKVKSGKENEKIFWFSMRQEPIVYINGEPHSPRDPEHHHVNLKTHMDVDQLKIMETHLAKVMKKRKKANPENKISILHDLDYVENPMDREDDESTLVVETIKDLESVYRDCKEKCNVSLEVIRVPVMEDKVPLEYMDEIINALKNEAASTPCIFTSQMGKGRATVGMVAACLVKEIIITAELRNMEEMKLINSDTLKDLLYEKFERIISSEEDEDPLAKGDFEVIKDLCAAVPEAVEAKQKVDIIMDKCGTPPRGVGIQNLRESIIQTKWKYDVALEDKQAVYKEIIINFIERYFHMICFSLYALEFGRAGYQKSFKDWFSEKKDLQDMVEEGKDKLEWSRTVDAAKLEQLKVLMADPNYKDNLSNLIKTLYEFAFDTYADLPRGQIKNNSMKKLCASTLMEILPEDIADKVNKKLETDPTRSHDFISIIGMVSYF